LASFQKASKSALCTHLPIARKLEGISFKEFLFFSFEIDAAPEELEKGSLVEAS
jgi:hypothetical protein